MSKPKIIIKNNFNDVKDWKIKIKHRANGGIQMWSLKINSVLPMI